MCVSHNIIFWNSYTLFFSNPNPKPNPNPNHKPNPNHRNSDTFKSWRLSFKVKILQRKGRLFSFLNIRWHISNNNVSFQRNKCAFHTKAFHEIHSYSFFLTLTLTLPLTLILTLNLTLTLTLSLTLTLNLTLTLEIHKLSKQSDYLSKESLYREKEDCSHF